MLKPNVYKFGILIENVVEHPATKRCIEGHAKTYWAALQPEYSDIATTSSTLTSEKISRYLSVMQSQQDTIANIRLKRLMFNLTGTCTGGRCVGWTALNAMWATSYDIDAKYGTDYHVRLQKWLAKSQFEDICVAGALTDAKGDRSLPPSKQPDPDAYLHVVEHRDDGVVVRGAKHMIAGVVAAHEIFVLPGRGLNEDEKDYAVAFAVPRDASNLLIVEARRPSDLREFEEGFDIPVEKGGITQSYLFFNDVYIPKERVFMCGEYEFTRQLVMNFIASYRTTMGGCVTGQGDLAVGTAILLARAHGLSEKIFTDKLVKMCTNNETTFAIGLGAAAAGRQHKSGVWFPDTLLANVNKIYVASLPYETKNLAQDIAGGIGETGCMPSYKDLRNPDYGYLIQKYLKSKSTAEVRMKLARLLEWLAIGAGVPGCMHGGGSPDVAKLMIKQLSDLDKKVELVKKLIEIDIEPSTPEKS